MGLISAYLYLAVKTTWLWATLLTVTLYWLYMRYFLVFYDTNIIRTDDKTIIITGAESGIGKETVNVLAARGGKIIMACKDVAMGEAAKNEIVKRTLNDKLEVWHLDLASIDSVRKFCAKAHDTLDSLDVLVNNASIYCVSSTTTVDELNLVTQHNHLGPFLLTNLLLDMLKKSTPSRIVFVTSITHHFHKFSLDSLHSGDSLPSCRAYFNTKLANILTAKYFARILQGTGVTVNTVHPGTVKPDPVTEECSNTFVATIFNAYRTVFGKTFEEGAMTSAYTATEPSLTYVTGQHFADCKVSGCVATITKDEILQEKLFAKSLQLVNLTADEIHL